MLDIVEWRLRRDGVRVNKLVGSMPLKERRSVRAALRRRAQDGYSLSF